MKLKIAADEANEDKIIINGADFAYQLQYRFLQIGSHNTGSLIPAKMFRNWQR